MNFINSIRESKKPIQHDLVLLKAITARCSMPIPLWEGGWERDKGGGGGKKNLSTQRLTHPIISAQLRIRTQVPNGGRGQ